MIDWWSDPDCVDEAGRPLFATMAQVFALEGEAVSSDPLASVIRARFGGKCYYVKRYVGNGRSWQRHWFGLRQWQVRPRVRKEWENHLAFQSWGIPTAKLVAYGLERQWGGFRRGALVTEEIVGACDLARLANQRDERLRDRGWLAAVSWQIARIARAMHDHGFAHNDLKWRNILIVDEGQPQVYLIDCPSGGYWWRPFLDYRIIKDLACLDKVGKYHLSRVQRLRFFLDYRQHARLNDEDKRMVRKILKFFEGRE